MESAEQRATRHWRRDRFGEVAEQYDSFRPRYPAALVDALCTTARLVSGARVLEVGCGTGQLTGLLRSRGLDVTALDVSGRMIDVARRRLGPGANLHVSSFEAFPVAQASIGLVVSADAFHWIDPEVRYDKAAFALRPGGWLAVVACDVRYDEPLQSAVLSMWIARSDDEGAWLRTPTATVAEEIRASGRFGDTMDSVHEWEMAWSPERVVGLEATRATALCWEPSARRQFSAELAARIGAVPNVRVTGRGHVVMAEVLTGLHAP